MFVDSWSGTRAFLFPLALASLFVAGCPQPLQMPAPPMAVPPRVESFSPAEAWAGEALVVRGEALAGTRGSVTVRVGGSAPVAPREVAPDGSWLSLDVPDDATDGAITILGDSGTAQSSASFRMKGFGRLRRGQLKVSADVRAPLDLVMPLSSTGATAVLSRPLDFFGLRQGPDAVRRLPVHNVVAVASAAPVRTFGFVAAEFPQGCTGEGDPHCEEAVLALWMLSRVEMEDATETGELPPALARLPVSFNPLKDPVSLSLDDDATHALVTGEEEAWLVDAAAPGQPRHLPCPDCLWQHSAWAGGSRFVVSDWDALRVVDWSSPEPVGAPFQPMDEGYEGRIFALSASNGRLAVATDNQLVAVVDASGEALRTARLLSLESRDQLLYDVSLSSDGQHVAVALQRELVVYDLRPEKPVPLASTEIPASAGRLWPGLSGEWLMATPGGALLVSQATGARIGEVRVRTKPQMPARRTARCGTASRDVLELPLSSFPVVERRDPVTLEPIAACPVLHVPDALGKVSRALPTADGERLFLVGPGGAALVEGSSRVAHPDLVDPFGASHRGLRVVEALLSPDDRALIVHDDNPTTTVNTHHVRVADLTAPWSTSLPVTTVESAEPLVRVAADNAGHLVIVGNRSVRVLSLAWARSGQQIESRPALQLAEGEEIRAAELRSGSLVLVVREASGGTSLRILSLETGALLQGPSDDLLGSMPSGTLLTASPSLRQLLWLEPGAVQSQLVLGAFDPRRALFSSPRQLPLSATQLLPSTDGESLVVVDGEGEKLMLFE